MWLFFYINCLIIGDYHQAQCMSSQNGGRFKTEKECRKEEIGITKNEYIKDGKLIVETREFTQGVCFYYKKDKLTKETYKIIKEK